MNLFDSQPEGGGRGGRRLGKGKALPLAPIPVGEITPQSACGLTAPLAQGSRRTKQTALPYAQRGKSLSPYTGEPQGEADSTSLCVKRSELPLYRGAEGRSRRHFLVCKEVRAPFAQGSRGTKQTTLPCAQRGKSLPPLHRGAEGRSRQHFLVRKEVRASFTQGSRRMKRRRRDGRSADSFRWTWWRRRGWICAGRRRGI